MKQQHIIKDILHQKIVKHYDKAQSWFYQKSHSLAFPFYSSFDLRDSSIKISPVDANLFPAGFNNICSVDKESSISICEQYLLKNFPSAKNIILLAEEHTHNPFYWDNIHTLKNLLQKTGDRKVSICVPGKNITKDTVLSSAQGHRLEVFLLQNKLDGADLIISNNDFSVDYGLDISIPVTPPVVAGWRLRRKHSFFEQYNLLAEEFAQLIEVEPEFLTIKTKRFTEFDPGDPQCLKRLKEESAVFLSELEQTYSRVLYKGEGRRPYLFLKNNAGTYGLGMTTIFLPEDIENWNYKIRKKMKSSKGGVKVTELIIQEGIASHLKKKGFVAEPVLYLIGARLAGGFLRTHGEKGARDNLNSPGAVYRSLCISDLEIEVEGKPRENVYGWIAHLGVLAVAYELRRMNCEG